MGLLIGTLVACVIVYALLRTAGWIGGGLVRLHQREAAQYRQQLERDAGPVQPLDRRDAWRDRTPLPDSHWPEPIRHPVTGQIVNFPNKGD